MDTQNRWDSAKLYFRCLGDGHLGQFCNHIRVCGIDNCKEVYHRLVHKARGVLPSGHSRGMGAEKKEELPSVSRENDSIHEGSRHNEGEIESKG